MKRLLFITLAMLFACLLSAEPPFFEEYYSNPNPKSFTAAYNYCLETLAADSTRMDIRFQMTYLVSTETDRLTQSIAAKAEDMPVGEKFQFANLLMAQGKYEDAIEQYNTLNTDSPGWSCPWRHKGQAFYNLKRYKEAETSLAMAIETNKQHYDAYIWMAKTQYQLKKYKEGLKNLETALTLNPAAEESTDEVISENSIRALHELLLEKTGKKK
jgi:tetratricopeptide (TPR) repeat protein